MFEEAIKSLIFSNKFEGEELDLGKLRYKASGFRKANFMQIPSGGKGKITFIDGGKRLVISFIH